MKAEVKVSGPPTHAQAYFDAHSRSPCCSSRSSSGSQHAQKQRTPQLKWKLKGNQEHQPEPEPVLADGDGVCVREGEFCLDLDGAGIPSTAPDPPSPTPSVDTASPTFVSASEEAYCEGFSNSNPYGVVAC